MMQNFVNNTLLLSGGCLMQQPASQTKTGIYHVKLSLCVCVCMAHCCSGCRTAGYPMALVQQGSVDVDVIVRARVTQIKLHHVTNVTIQ